MPHTELAKKIALAKKEAKERQCTMFIAMMDDEHNSLRVCDKAYLNSAEFQAFCGEMVFEIGSDGSITNWS